MELVPLLSGYPIIRINGELPRRITGFTANSKQVKPGTLYICIRGERNDGHSYVHEAIHKGALAIVSEHPLQICIPVICVAGTRHFLSYFANRYYGQPSHCLNITGITGTNGKTTTAHYLYQIYQAAGIKAALMGTVGVKVSDRYLKQALTTPGAEELHKSLWQLAQHGVKAVAMEVSSHALVQSRVEHCRFTTAIFTNLSREHLDYHQTMDRYFQAKAHLFELLNKTKGAKAILNADDTRSYQIKGLSLNPWTYGVENPANVRVTEILPLTGGGAFVRVDAPGGSFCFMVRLHGIYNIYNALAATAAALAEGISPRDVAQGIESLRLVPGRLEQLPSPPGVRVYLDYAHTPDGLEKVLQAVGEYPHRKIILVFGCRGNRDRGKRPHMGQIADHYADLVILTSDNPAGEDPDQIAWEIAHLMEKKPVIITDREQAVHYALDTAKEGDIILITGKGREGYQLIGDTALTYSDFHVVSGYLNNNQL